MYYYGKENIAILVPIITKTTEGKISNAYVYKLQNTKGI